MAHKLTTALAALAFATGIASAQDATTVLQNATKAMGGTDLKSIQYSGTGLAGTLGQALNATSPWPELLVTSYSQTIDYPSRSSKEEVTRTQKNPPARGGGAPFAGEQKLVNMVAGQYAWNQPPGAPAPQPALGNAEERQLQIWLTPHGFLQAALANNASAAAGTEGGKKVTTISFTVLGKYKMTGAIDGQNMVVKTQTWIANPVLGDMPVETSFSNYKDFGGVKFPTKIVQKQGGSMTLDLNVTKVQANVANAALQAPEAVQRATAPPVRVESQKLADGVWFLGGGTHNSVLVEYPNFLALVEAPLTEERSLALIEEAKKLVPGKQIRFVVNTHQHFDHSGGLRTFAANNAIIITRLSNIPYYRQIWSLPHTLAPDLYSQKPPAKVQFFEVKDVFNLTDLFNQEDLTVRMEIYPLQSDNHNDGMLIAYLPQSKILIEADDFTPPAPNGPPLVPLAMGFGTNLYQNLQRLNLEVTTIAPLHGRVAPFAELPKAIGK